MQAHAGVFAAAPSGALLGAPAGLAVPGTACVRAAAAGPLVALPPKPLAPPGAAPRGGRGAPAAQRPPAEQGDRLGKAAAAAASAEVAAAAAALKLVAATTALRGDAPRGAGSAAAPPGQRPQPRPPRACGAEAVAAAHPVATVASPARTPSLPRPPSGINSNPSSYQAAAAASGRGSAPPLEVGGGGAGRRGPPPQVQRPGSSASDRASRSGPGAAAAVRRGGSSARAPPGPVNSDDCAEYSDRFLPGYERCRLLGRGACAVVWLARPAGDARGPQVAIKQVAKGATGKRMADVESARREIALGSRLFHAGGEPKLSTSRNPGIRHIARLLESHETKRDVWLVMDYGGTCLTKMAYEIKGEFARGERLYRVHHLPTLCAMKRDPQVLQALVGQLLSALCVLAELGIVHSDIKPDNILIEEDEQGKLRGRLIDLGSAFPFESPEGLALATPEYMPPEALEACAARSAPRPGRRSAAEEVSGQSRSQSRPWSFDVWSLGAILLELAAGAPLWLSFKCRVADDQRANSAALGLFAVPGRDPAKILSRQSEALRQRGLDEVLREAKGVPLDRNGLDLLSGMLAWNPDERVSPQQALAHPWCRRAAC